MKNWPKETVWSPATQLMVTGADCDICEKRIKRADKVIVSLNLKVQRHLHVTCAKNAGLKAGK